MNRWRDALAELLAIRGQALKRYAYLICGTDEEADDLVQEALVKVLSRTHGVSSDVRAPEPYLKRVIVNIYLDRTRARRTWQRYLPRLAQPEDRGDWTADVIRDGEVRSSLFTLSPRQRACVVLRFYDDLTIAQVAEVLGCSEGSVKRHLSDSMARLRPLLNESA
jgi:RNA polymerase sigma factor (sigma-70 family)